LDSNLSFIEDITKTFWSLFSGHTVLFTNRKCQWHTLYCATISATDELLYQFFQIIIKLDDDDDDDDNDLHSISSTGSR